MSKLRGFIDCSKHNYYGISPCPQCRHFSKSCPECQKKDERIERLERALEFYAEGKHKYCECYDTSDIWHEHDYIIEDGETARAALDKK